MAKKSSKSSKLTTLQREFISQYFLSGLNATEAVIQAGYKVKDRQYASQIGTANLQKPHIKDEIDRRLNENAISANEILYRLSEQARGDLADFWDISGAGIPKINLKKAQERGKLHLLKKITIQQTKYGQNIEIELHDAQNALVQLGRYYRLFTDKVEIIDWKTEAVTAIRHGEIEYIDLADELGYDLASELFQQAGVPIGTRSLDD